MKFCSLVAITCLAVVSIGHAAPAMGMSPGNSKMPVRQVKHVRSASSHHHGSDCGCGQSAIVEMPMVSLDTCGGSCGSACTDACGTCEDCDPCLLSLMFDDMCNAVDSLFSCQGCRSSCDDACCVEASACDECGDWDPCASCDDSKKRRSRRSPRRRPKCDTCGDCSGLWDGFCTNSCSSGCGAAGGCDSCSGGAMHHPMPIHGMEMHAAPPMELKEVPPPAAAGSSKAASRAKNNRSVLRTPTPAASPSPIRRTNAVLSSPTSALPPAKPLPAKTKQPVTKQPVTKQAAPKQSKTQPSKTQPSKSPVLNAPQVNRSVKATPAQTVSEVRPAAAEEPAELIATPAAPIMPINPLRSVR